MGGLYVYSRKYSGRMARCRVCGELIQGLFHAHSMLATKLIRKGGVLDPSGTRLIWDHVFTTEGRDAVIDQIVDGTPYDWNFHGSGTGAVAEAVGDVGLGAEVETRDADAVKSQPTSDVLRSVDTHTYAGSFTITEHGLFDQVAVAGDTLLDRTVFGGIAVVASDAIQFTFDFTLSSGG